MKRFTVFLILVMMAGAGSISAQESKSDAKNWISGEVSLLGGGARYERMLGSKFSVGGDVYFSSFFIVWNEFEVGAFGRFYPLENGFFVEAGLGYHLHTALTLGGGLGLRSKVVSGIGITPAVGWQIDVGRPGGFFISPGIKFPITLGVNTLTSKFGAGFGIVPYIGLGAAF
jgi:hypothetical protein